MMKTETQIDIIKESLAPHSSTLNLVGMENVELPIILQDENGSITKVPAKCKLFISLDDPHAKGIHMSRLYLQAKEILESKVLNYQSLEELCKIFVNSHLDLSFSAKVEISFELMLKRKALSSSNEGWRFYPITISTYFDRSKNNFESIKSFLRLELTYSSTCPCSSALAKESNIENFKKEFNQESNLSYDKVLNWLKSSRQATPHAQRSQAQIQIEFSSLPEKNIFKQLIDKLENTLGTPVQAAVKREDEKSFAILSSENPMFSEDACRKLKAELENENNIKDYRIKVEHFESLHPHNAVSVSIKGIPGGFKA